jgi:hypothetical protein
VTQVAPAALAQLSALETATVQRVVLAHQSEIAAAQAKYDAEHAQGKPLK